MNVTSGDVKASSLLASFPVLEGAMQATGGE